MCDGVSGANRVGVAADAVQFVARGVVARVDSTMAAGESQQRHRSHPSGAENHAEYVEVHLSTHGSQRALLSKALIQESPDENSYEDSVLPVSATQLNSYLGVKIDTQRREKHWHDFVGAGSTCKLSLHVFGPGFSRYYTAMLLSRSVVLVISITASCLGCHPKVPAPAAEDPQGDLSVRVVNRNRIDVMVYVSHDGVRSRLGLATASTTTDFMLPMRLLGAGHEYRLIGDPLGVRIVITTETLVARPGDEVTWSLEDSFARSTVVVH